MFTPFKSADTEHPLIQKHEQTINLPLETISSEVRRERFRYFAVEIMNTTYETMPIPATLQFPFEPSNPPDRAHDFEMCLLYRYSLRWLLVNGYLASSEMMNPLNDPFDVKNQLFRFSGAGSDIMLTDKGLVAIERVMHFEKHRFLTVAAKEGSELTKGTVRSSLSDLLVN